MIWAASVRPSLDRIDAKAYLDETRFIQAQLDAELLTAEQAICGLKEHLQSSSRILGFRQSALAPKARLTDAKLNLGNRLDR